MSTIDFDLNIHNYNFNELLSLFKINDIGKDDKKYYSHKMDEKLFQIKKNYSKEIYNFFKKTKMIILSIFNLLENNIIKNNNEIESYVNYLKNIKNLEVYIEKDDEYALYDKIMNDVTSPSQQNQYNVKIVDSDDNSIKNSVFNLNLNTPYYNIHESRINPSLNDKNNTNIIVNTAVNEISPGDLNSVKRITQLLNLNLNSCFRSNYYQSDPCDFLYILPLEIKNVTALRLVSIEIPNSWYLISKLKKNNIFEIVFTVPSNLENTTDEMYINSNMNTNTNDDTLKCGYVIEIPDGNYDSETLQDFLNSTYFYQTSSSSEYFKTYLKYIKFSINPYNFKSTFELTNIPNTNNDDDIKFSLKFSQGINQNIMNTFGWVIGFRMGNYINIYESITSEGLFDAGGDRYIYVCINDYQYNNNPLNVVCFDKSIFNEDVIAKIPMVNGKLSLIINDNNNSLSKIRKYNGPVNLSRLQIKIVDHFGSIIDLNNMDFSMTLELQLLYENFNFKNVSY
jgi:hypothetical protein